VKITIYTKTYYDDTITYIYLTQIIIGNKNMFFPF